MSDFYVLFNLFLLFAQYNASLRKPKPCSTRNCNPVYIVVMLLSLYNSVLLYNERSIYMKESPTLYRKRMIPDECVLLKDDVILEQNEDFIITKWNTLKPRRDFHHGYSCYYLNKGIKVSKFYREDNSLLYWYCDIVDYHYEENDNSLVVTDLLADVVIYPDGDVKVLDIDELAIALEKKICPVELVTKALKQLDMLLNLIYDDKFEILTSPIENIEKI